MERLINFVIVGGLNLLKLMFITNNTEMAKNAEEAGVDRIFVDLESIGKLERQGHLDTHISDHTISDISKIKTTIKTCDILVRVNPIHENSRIEIHKVIEEGADIVMLPMFTSRKEVEEFVDYVDGKAKTCLLLETPQALARIDEILEVEGIDEIHVGLNDLHLGLGLDFIFEIVSGGLIDYIANKILAKGMDFGFGGIAKIGEGAIPAELVIGEHYRLGSQMVILSRTFRNEIKNSEQGKSINLKEEIWKIREYEDIVSAWNKIELLENHEIMKNKVRGYLHAKYPKE